MEFYEKIRAQQENVDQGQLKVTVMTADGTRPVENARVKISYTGESGQTIEEVRTDSSGQIPVLDVKTPPAGIQHGTVRAATICGIYGSGRGGGF